MKDARSIVGPEMLVGRVGAQHRTGPAGGARRGQLSGRRAGVSFGHEAIRAFPGVALLRQVAAEIRLPAFAIGGIAAKTSPRCWRPDLRG